RGRRRWDVTLAGLVREGVKVGGCGPRELRRHHRRIRTHRLTAFAAAVATLLVATASGSGEARRIRLCADPSNPPFSSQHPAEPVGVQAMTLSDQLAYERGWNRKVYLKSEELFAALVSSEVDAVVVESAFAGSFLRKSPGFRAHAVRDPQRELPIGAAVRKTD